MMSTEQTKPVVELAALAMARGERAVYRIIDVPARNLTAPMNYVSLTVGERPFVGEGRWFEEARNDAAAKALRELRPLPYPENVRRQPGQQPVPEVKSAGGHMPTDGSDFIKRKITRNEIEKILRHIRKKYRKPKPKDGSQAENPVCRLLEIQQAKHERGPVYSIIEERGQPHCAEFTIQCTVGDMSTKGSGRCKKHAARNAANAMMRRMGMGPSWPTGTLPHTSGQPGGIKFPGGENAGGSREQRPLFRDAANGPRGSQNPVQFGGNAGGSREQRPLFRDHANGPRGSQNPVQVREADR